MQAGSGWAADMHKEAVDNLYYAALNPSQPLPQKEHIPTPEERAQSMASLRGALKDIPRAFGRGLLRVTTELGRNPS